MIQALDLRGGSLWSDSSGNILRDTTLYVPLSDDAHISFCNNTMRPPFNL